MWIVVAVAILVWTAFETPGWDVSVIYKAIHQVAAGNPYADGVAELTRFHYAPPHAVGKEPPFIYVYPPITLVALRFIGRLPDWMSHSIYWMAYIASTIILVWAGTQMFERRERTYLNHLAPLAVFFPGLLVNGTVLSGNIAIILYAAITLAAVHAWRYGRWRWLYLAVVLASCIKGPFLLFALLPVLSARKQWLWTACNIAIGLALVGMQAALWPMTFRHYLAAIDLMFRFSHDFGCSPAGLLGDSLARMGRSYTPASQIFYAMYAMPLLGTLFLLSRRYLDGDFSIEQWAPVAFVGLTLLNPRLIDYDLAPATLPLALIVYRLQHRLQFKRRAAASVIFLFLSMNLVGVQSWEWRKLMEGALVPGLFAIGCWTLLRTSRQESQNPIYMPAA